MSFADRLVSFRESLNGDSIVLAIEAQRFIEKMRADHPNELAEWLETHAVGFVADALACELRTSRRRSMNPDLFPEDPDEQAEHARTLFDQRFCIDAENYWRPLGEMTGPDHLFVAQRHETQANTELMLAQFHRAVARKVGKRRTRDAFTEETYKRLLASFNKKNSPTTDPPDAVAA